MVHCLMFVLTLLSVCAQAAELQAAWPGDPADQPAQLPITMVASLPTQNMLCPVCTYSVCAPLPDTLMEPVDGQRPHWQMHADTRDSDTAPWPGEKYLDWQADLIICPKCGFSAKASAYDQSISQDIRDWTLEELQPNLRWTQKLLLGQRADAMEETAIIDFFNDQTRIPDSIRTEHYRAYAHRAGLPVLQQAEAAWVAAWALRRTSAGISASEALARLQNSVLDQLPRGTWQARMAALQTQVDRSAGRRANNAEYYAARLLLAGWYIRQGRTAQAREIHTALLEEARERFLKPEQDPFWSSTNVSAGRSTRLNQLEVLRSELEAEISARTEQLSMEQGLLAQAADLLRQALLDGEVTDPDAALLYAYLIGEFLRRTNDLPLAAEWMTSVVSAAAPDSPAALAAAACLDELHQQAADSVNLLSALGRDSDALLRLRAITTRTGGQQ